MTHSTAFDEFSDADAARARIRLRTLVWLRWLAVIGQTAAILLADRYLGVQLPLGPCLAAVGALMISNLVATFVFPENRRLSEPETLVTLETAHGEAVSPQTLESIAERRVGKALIRLYRPAPQ